MALTPGTKLGPYEVLSPLGAGGMGEVYKARDTRLDRTVAIKVLPDHLAATPDLKSRFEREARAVSSLNHPHICTLYDIGSQDNIDYLVMEHIEGETLASRLERGPLPTAEVLRYAAEIADALDKAHRQGLVHRDLKPGNVMLTKSGAKLLDFGLARVTAGAAPPGSSGSMPASILLSQTPTMATPLTGAGMIVGTFQYMAPEQLEGLEADARSDIWAFGATVYEMATGLKAFTGHSQASLIASILKEQPRPIAELQPLAPPGLDRVVQRCLAKDPDDRWQTARDLAHELKWIAQAGSQAGVAAPVAARRRNRERLLMAIAAAGVLGCAILGVLLVLGAPKPLEVVRFDIRPPSMITAQDAPRISPDGRILAYTAVDSLGISRVWLRNMSATKAEPLPGTEGIAYRPFWSPDSRYLGFLAGGKLKKIAVGGGPAVTICDAPSGADGSWSPTGVILFDGGTNDPIRRVLASGGLPAAAFPVDSAKSEQVGWPCFLPDGKHFLFMEITSRTIRVGELGSSKTRTIGNTDTRIEFAPPGYVLFVKGLSLVAQEFDTGALKLRGEPFPVAEPIRTGGNGAADFSVSATGTLVYTAGSAQTSRLLWVDRTGKELGTVPTGSADSPLNAALSPDGRHVAYRIFDANRKRDIWITDLVRGVPTRFTFDPGNENHPTWSPDGSRIAYYADMPGAEGIYIKSASGAGEAERLVALKDEASITQWAHGVLLYFRFPANGQSEIWEVPIEGDHQPRPLKRGQFNFSQGMISPDGRWLSYTSNESGRNEVYVETYPEHTGKWQISTTGGSDARWNPNGKELLYLGPDQRMMSVGIDTRAGFQADVPKSLCTAQVTLPDFPLRTHWNLTADGQRFLLGAPLGQQSLAGSSVVLNWATEASRR
jgi:eukaryotic-like serine/threonine-protein kinase